MTTLVGLSPATVQAISRSQYPATNLIFVNIKSGKADRHGGLSR